MGCHIHLHAEVKINGEWHTYAIPDVRRNYPLFARMAGVRRYGARMLIEPIAEPRGLPVDASVVTRHCAEHEGVDGHSHSWLSAEEILVLDETRDEYDPPPSGYDAMRYGSADLFGWFYGNNYSDWSRYPDERPEGIEDVRFVFWFDD